MKYLIAIILIALPGCAPLNAVQSGIADRGAAISDEALQTSEFMLCRGITVGSWLRAYGDSAERAAAWRTLCSRQAKETPAK